ncbi:MAG: protein phosphatase 2C domain-containing protein [Lachnospiraceae bacterium]|nr:protein phosphatase 2C domain-containing protein [Lachnospiraceae bacterium]
MKIAAAYLCDQGKVRTRNQDNLYFHEKILSLYHLKSYSRFHWQTATKKAVCLGVFDGMGGEQYGEEASFLAAEVLRAKMWENRTGRIPGDILREVCYTANEAIYKRTLELAADRIGTTAAIIYLQYDRIWICNVGDSRIYRLRSGILERLSLDHVWKGECKGKPGLTQHLGMNPEEITLFPYIVDDAVMRRDKYLICSDGLTDMVPEEVIKNILNRDLSLLKCNRLLLKTALDNGGRDNITIITCKVEQ